MDSDSANSANDPQASRTRPARDLGAVRAEGTPVLPALSFEERE